MVLWAVEKAVSEKLTVCRKCRAQAGQTIKLLPQVENRLKEVITLMPIGLQLRGIQLLLQFDLLTDPVRLLSFKENTKQITALIQLGNETFLLFF